MKQDISADMRPSMHDAITQLSVDVLDAYWAAMKTVLRDTHGDEDARLNIIITLHEAMGDGVLRAQKVENDIEQSMNRDLY